MAENERSCQLQVWYGSSLSDDACNIGCLTFIIKSDGHSPHKKSGYSSGFQEEETRMMMKLCMLAVFCLFMAEAGSSRSKKRSMMNKKRSMQTMNSKKKGKGQKKGKGKGKSDKEAGFFCKSKVISTGQSASYSKDVSAFSECLSIYKYTSISAFESANVQTYGYGNTEFYENVYVDVYVSYYRENWCTGESESFDLFGSTYEYDPFDNKIVSETGISFVLDDLYLSGMYTKRTLPTFPNTTNEELPQPVECFPDFNPIIIEASLTGNVILSPIPGEAFSVTSDCMEKTVAFDISTSNRVYRSTLQSITALAEADLTFELLSSEGEEPLPDDLFVFDCSVFPDVECYANEFGNLGDTSSDETIEELYRLFPGC
eukprot:scaffold26219_cov195-Amphora_coffeaeformis.AAC.1